jgi:GxxExxY protein
LNTEKEKKLYFPIIFPKRLKLFISRMIVWQFNGGFLTVPIIKNTNFKAISEDEFHIVDYRVMSLAFALHNEFGRFYNERIYQNELALRCKKDGFEFVETEVPIRLVYKTFSKTFFIDLLIDNSVIYELKSLDSINAQHKKQTLNYLLLAGLNHGKIINFHPASVNHYFVSSKLSSKRRFEFNVIDSEWNSLTDKCVWLKDLIINLLKEWGAFLKIDIFYKAMYHFSDGVDNIVSDVEIINGSRVIGKQKMHLLNRKTSFHISGITRDFSRYNVHLHRLLNHTSLKAMQWINFNHHNIEFRTIIK